MWKTPPKIAEELSVGDRPSRSFSIDFAWCKFTVSTKETLFRYTFSNFSKNFQKRMIVWIAWVLPEQKLYARRCLRNRNTSRSHPDRSFSIEFACSFSDSSRARDRVLAGEKHSKRNDSVDFHGTETLCWATTLRFCCDNFERQLETKIIKNGRPRALLVVFGGFSTSDFSILLHFLKSSWKTAQKLYFLYPNTFWARKTSKLLPCVESDTFDASLALIIPDLL